MTLTEPTIHRQVRPIALADVAPLSKQLAADNHITVMPTHIFERNGQIAGAASIGAVCLVLPWFDTHQCRARDSRFFIAEMRRQVAARLPAEHPGWVCVPLPMTSPFQPHGARFGLMSAGVMDLTFINVKQNYGVTTR